MTVRASERAGKKAGEAIIALSVDPRISNTSLGRYLEAQQLPDTQRQDLALVLVHALMSLAKYTGTDATDRSVYEMIGPYYRQHL